MSLDHCSSVSLADCLRANVTIPVGRSIFAYNCLELTNSDRYFSDFCATKQRTHTRSQACGMAPGKRHAKGEGARAYLNVELQEESHALRADALVVL